MSALGHREDIKAVLRKRFGSVRQFEVDVGLPKNAVSDFLRGKSSLPTQRALETELSKQPSGVSDESSDLSDSSTTEPDGHRLSEGGF